MVITASTIRVSSLDGYFSFDEEGSRLDLWLPALDAGRVEDFFDEDDFLAELEEDFFTPELSEDRETNFFPDGERSFFRLLVFLEDFFFILSILYIVKLSIIAKIPAAVQYMEK